MPLASGYVEKKKKSKQIAIFGVYKKGNFKLRMTGHV